MDLGRRKTDCKTIAEGFRHRRETTLLASRNATEEDFETVLAAMRAGEVPVEALKTYRIRRRSDGFRTATPFAFTASEPKDSSPVAVLLVKLITPA